MKNHNLPIMAILMMALIACTQQESTDKSNSLSNNRPNHRPNSPPFDRPNDRLLITWDTDSLSWSSVNDYREQLSVYDRTRGLLGVADLAHSSTNNPPPFKGDTVVLTLEKMASQIDAVGMDGMGGNAREKWQIRQRTWSKTVLSTPDSSYELRRREGVFEDYLFIENKSARQGKINDSTYIAGLFPRYPGKPLSEEWIQHKMERLPIGIIRNDSLDIPIVNPGIFHFNAFAENPIFTANSQFVYAGYAHQPELIRYDLAKGTSEIIYGGENSETEPFTDPLNLDSISDNSYRVRYYQSSRLVLTLHTSEERPRQWIRTVKEAQSMFNEEGLVNPPHTAPFTIEISNEDGTSIQKTLRLDGVKYQANNSFVITPYIYVYLREKSTPQCGVFDGFLLD